MALACSSWGSLLPGDDIGGLDERAVGFPALTLTSNSDKWLHVAKEVTLLEATTNRSHPYAF